MSRLSSGTPTGDSRFALIEQPKRPLCANRWDRDNGIVVSTNLSRDCVSNLGFERLNTARNAEHSRQGQPREPGQGYYRRWLDPEVAPRGLQGDYDVCRQNTCALAMHTLSVVPCSRLRMVVGDAFWSCTQLGRHRRGHKPVTHHGDFTINALKKPEGRCPLHS